MLIRSLTSERLDAVFSLHGKVWATQKSCLKAKRQALGRGGGGTRLDRVTKSLGAHHVPACVPSHLLPAQT